MVKFKNKEWSPGLVIVVLFIVSVSLIPGPFKLTTILIIILGIYFIVSGLLNKHHEDTLALLMGISLLTCMLIWTTMESTALTDFSNLVYLITALLFITGGILGWLGLIPEWFRSLGR